MACVPSHFQSDTALGLCGGQEKWACGLLLTQGPGSAPCTEDSRKRAMCLCPQGVAGPLVAKTCKGVATM